MCGICIVIPILPMSKFGPSWHSLKPFTHWGNNSFMFEKDHFPLLGRLTCILAPHWRSNSRGWTPMELPSSQSHSLAAFWLLLWTLTLTLIYFFEHDLLVLTLNSLKWNSIKMYLLIAMTWDLKLSVPFSFLHIPSPTLNFKRKDTNYTKISSIKL